MIDTAKADGRWAFLDDIDALIKPHDLAAALDASPEARAAWDETAPSARKHALYHNSSGAGGTSGLRRRAAWTGW